MKSKLARQITVEVALVILGGMFIYAVFQYFAQGGHPMALLVRHLWHTGVLALLIYGVLIVRLRSQVFRPLDQVFHHAFMISKGNLGTQKYAVANNEIDHIGKMMNQLAINLESMQRASWKDNIDTMDRRLAYVQGSDSVTTDLKGEVSAVREDLRKLLLGIAESEGAARPAPTDDGQG